MGCSLNQRTAEFSLCNTLVLLLDLAFKQYTHNRQDWPKLVSKLPTIFPRCPNLVIKPFFESERRMLAPRPVNIVVD